MNTLFDNSHVRRQDRLLPEERAWQLLKEAEWSVLSMVDDEGKPYGIPVSHVWDGGKHIYIHCAPQGRKLNAIGAHGEVSLCVVGRVNLLPERFTTEYESIVVSGTATTSLPDDEKRAALSLLIDKLSPEHKVVGMKYAAGSFHRLQIFRIEILQMSGKQKRVNPSQS